jgi:hypothetical protein
MPEILKAPPRQEVVEPVTDAVLQRTSRQAPTLVGAAPLTLAIDIGRRATRVRASRGEQTVGEELEYPTPDRYQDGIVRLIHAKNKLLGFREHPDAVGVSTGEPLSEGGQTASATSAGESFSHAVADATGLPSTADVIVLPRDGARAFAQSIVYPAPGRDGAYLSMDTRNARLRGAAVYTPQGWVASYEPDENVRGSLVTIVGRTFATFREAKLDVAVAAVAGVDEQDRINLRRRLQERFDVPAPNLVEAKFGKDSSLVGAEYAAEQLIRPDGKPPIVLYNGIEEIKTRRSNS